MEGTCDLMANKTIYIEESPYHPGKYMIRAHFEEIGITKAEGSFNIVLARLMGLSYPDFLRMCRDCFGAEIIGKGNLYPVPYFKRSDELTALVKILNARADSVKWDKEHPNFSEHEAYVKEHCPSFYEEVKKIEKN